MVVDGGMYIFCQGSHEKGYWDEYREDPTKNPDSQGITGSC